MSKPTKTNEYVFLDIVPQSLYGSLIELKIRVQSNEMSGEYAVYIPDKYKKIGHFNLSAKIFNESTKLSVFCIVVLRIFLRMAIIWDVDSSHSS